MKCRVCVTEDVPDNWLFMPWCDPCLTRASVLRRERPELTVSEIRDVIREEGKR
jgi:hypothetical protein